MNLKRIFANSQNITFENNIIYVSKDLLIARSFEKLLISTILWLIDYG